MKILYRILGFFAVIIWLAVSCNKELIVSPVKDIKGQWEWILTYSVYILSDSNPLTPSNSGINEIIVFNADNTWFKKVNGIKTDSGIFSLGYGSYTPYPGATHFDYDSIAFFKQDHEFVGQDYYRIYSDTLSFSPSYADRFKSYSLPHNGSKYWKRITD